MNFEHVQTLVLRSPPGPSVSHLILTVPDDADRCGNALALLNDAFEPCFGPEEQEQTSSIGLSFAGLKALGMLDGYLRLLHRLAPAFAEGAPLRSLRLGDSGASAASRWKDEFHFARAHVLVSWHGKDAKQEAEEFKQLWRHTLAIPPGFGLAAQYNGQRLGAPDNEKGEWLHYRYRDGLSDIWIAGGPKPEVSDVRPHRAGEVLLGRVNTAGFTPFGLSQAPEKVRAFFLDSSFGILRPMKQDVRAFDAQIALSAKAWDESEDFVRAKLCGRWPDGRQLQPGQNYQPDLQLRPGDRNAERDAFKLDLEGDTEGKGCPFSSHLRRMRAAPDRDGATFERPLLRRGVPYGTAAWKGVPEGDTTERGLIGHFFCASIENQFEHLVGQWAAQPPLGSAPDDEAPDPLIGVHADADATLRIPGENKSVRYLRGFGAHTTAVGTMYAWYPGREAWKALLETKYEKEEDSGPWS